MNLPFDPAILLFGKSAASMPSIGSAAGAATAPPMGPPAPMDRRMDIRNKAQAARQNPKARMNMQEFMEMNAAAERGQPATETAAAGSSSYAGSPIQAQGANYLTASAQDALVRSEDAIQRFVDAIMFGKTDA